MSTVAVTVDVEGMELTPDQQRVVDAYQTNIETFLRKDADYGQAYVRAAIIDCYLTHGTVTDELLFEQVMGQLNTRMLDKQCRYYQLMFQTDGGHVGGKQVDEALPDTLLDWGNYTVMTATQLEKYMESPTDYASGYLAQYDDPTTLTRES